MSPCPEVGVIDHKRTVDPGHERFAVGEFSILANVGY